MKILSMSRDQRDRWERERAKGPLWFVLRYAVLFSAGIYIFRDVVSYSGATPEDLPFLFGTGLVTGMVVWLVAEYDYNKRTSGVR